MAEQVFIGDKPFATDVMGAYLLGLNADSETRLFATSLLASAADLAAKQPANDTLDAVSGLDPAQISSICFSEAQLDALDRSIFSVALLVTASRKTMFFWNAGDCSGDVDLRPVPTRSVAANTFSMGTLVSTNVNDTTKVITVPGHGLTSASRILLAATTNGARANAPWKITQDADTAAAPGGNADNFKITGAGNSANTVFPIVGTATMTFQILSELTTGEALRVPSTTADLTAGQIVYAVVTSNYQFKVAATYLDAVAAVPVTLPITAGTALNFMVEQDPLHMATFVPSGLPRNGSGGAWTTRARDIGPTDIGLVHLADCSHALQAAVWLSAYRRCEVQWPSGIFLTSFEIRLLTAGNISTVVQATAVTSPYNGVLIRGRGSEWTRIRASATFPNNADIFRFNGNRYGVESHIGASTSNGALFNQGLNMLVGIGIEGRGRTVGSGVSGISCQGTWGMILDDVKIVSVSGKGWLHRSAVLAGSAPADEVENVFKLILRNVEILGIGEEGMLSVISRPVMVICENIRIRDTKGSGAKGGFVAGRFSGSISSCGDAVGEGCLHILNAASATANEALARNLDLTGLQLEAGYDFDLYLEQVVGVRCAGTINSAGSNAIATKRGLRIGAGAKNLTFDNLQINSGIGGSYRNFEIEEGAENIIFLNCPSTYVSTGVETGIITSPKNVQFINAPETMTLSLLGNAPVGSNFNGKPLNMAGKKWPRFKAETITAADLANVTGDGTEVFSAAAGSVTEVYDDANAYASGVFTAPCSGLYAFTAKVAITGFSTTNTSAELQLVKNHLGTPVRYMIDRRMLSSPATGDRHDLRGHEQVYMAAGDTMVWSIKVNGTGKTVDILRAENPATHQFSGTLLDYAN